MSDFSPPDMQRHLRELLAARLRDDLDAGGLGIVGVGQRELRACRPGTAPRRSPGSARRPARTSRGTGRASCGRWRRRPSAAPFGWPSRSSIWSVMNSRRLASASNSSTAIGLTGPRFAICLRSRCARSSAAVAVVERGRLERRSSGMPSSSTMRAHRRVDLHLELALLDTQVGHRARSASSISAWTSARRPARRGWSRAATRSRPARSARGRGASRAQCSARSCSTM